ncbi:MAG TPA: hypothetical protein VHX61_19615 [Rhizomicrobium sp.]|nr:hypothetical protein [Rhizomicrobium sp.]
MSRVVGHQISGEKIDPIFALFASHGLHPQEIFHRNIAVAIKAAICLVESADFRFQAFDQFARGTGIGAQVEMLDLLAHDPGGHGIEIEALDVAADAIGFEERYAAPHEGIGDDPSRKIIRLEEGLGQRLVAELRKHKTAKQRPRPAREPFVHGDDGPEILLDLLLPQRHRGHESGIKALFDGHSREPSL